MHLILKGKQKKKGTVSSILQFCVVYLFLNLPGTIFWKKIGTVDHECPTLGLAWAALNEKELSWDAYKIYNTDNVFK